VVPLSIQTTVPCPEITMSRVTHYCRERGRVPRDEQHHRDRPVQRALRLGPGWQIHGSVEDTKLSTNKQHTHSLSCLLLHDPMVHSMNECDQIIRCLRKTCFPEVMPGQIKHRVSRLVIELVVFEQVFLLPWDVVVFTYVHTLSYHFTGTGASLETELQCANDLQSPVPW
jgi:hypothetical protein